MIASYKSAPMLGGMAEGVDLKRLDAAMRERGLDQSALASRVGCTPGAINQIVNGTTHRSRFLPAIARELGVSVAWLQGAAVREDPLGDTEELAARRLDAVLVPHLSLTFSMGGGSVISEPTVLGYFSVPKEWLRGHIRGTPEDVAIIMGEGDSMEPTIRDGDMLLIDRAQRTMRQSDQIWAIAVRDSGSVKRLRRARSGGYEIHSDNPSVPVDFADDGEMVIVGRMIGVLNWK